VYCNKYVNIAKLASIKLYIMRTEINAMSARIDLVAGACEDMASRITALEQRPFQ